MARETTMLELVNELSARSRTDREVIAAVVALVNSGEVCLCGNFRGCRFDPALLERDAA